MPLSIYSFKEVATGLQTHKEKTVPDNTLLLTENELDALREQFDCLDEKLFQQVVTVRKRHCEHVPQMLNALVSFRQEQGWPYRIQAADLNPLAVHAQAETPNEDKNLPNLRISFGKVDPSVAPAKDYHLELQYAVQESSRYHADGQISLTCDFHACSFAVLTRLNKADLLRSMAIFNTYPVKVKHVYLVRTTWAMRLAMRSVLALASRSVREKVTFVTDPSWEPTEAVGKENIEQIMSGPFET